MNIVSYQESPMLSALVQAGDLPPVKERLPDDPIVIEPFDRIGVYGGTLRVFPNGFTRINNNEPPLSMCPQVSRILPSWASAWQYSDDARMFTLKLRSGLRWSDGAPLTSSDFVWWYQHVFSNTSLTPSVPSRHEGMVVRAPDPVTVEFHFASPYAFMLEEMAHRGENFLLPGHFLQHYHPDFRGLEDLDAEAKKAGYMNWMAYFKAAQKDSFRDPIGTPTIKPYRIVSRSPTLEVWERNPYYHKIDPAGHQLPYIDEVLVLNITNPEVVSAKVSTGQIDFAGSELKTQDIPLYKAGEDVYGFRTLIWNRLHAVDVLIQFNMTVEKPKMRKLFRDRRFRYALSIAIDRDEINDILYFGQGTPRQTSVIPSSRYYESTSAEAAIEYDPDQARILLDEIGVRDTNGDGFREYPDGEPLVIVCEWLDIETPKGETMELVKAHWKRIGIDVRLKEVSESLQAARARGNNMDMTVWHADRSTDILFPLLPSWFVPMYISWDMAMWSAWSRWYVSGDGHGEVPTPEVMQLVDWWDEMRRSADAAHRIELGKRILRSQAENIWSIGIVGLAPQPIVVSQRLHNVSERGYWGWDNMWLRPYHTETWFLDTEERYAP
jgi:peptide/nickel transport system substrate-binding protein